MVSSTAFGPSTVVVNEVIFGTAADALAKLIDGMPVHLPLFLRAANELDMECDSDPLIVQVTDAAKAADLKRFAIGTLRQAQIDADHSSIVFGAVGSAGVSA
ncbi:unnamed protein product, partial [Prorocentrum cordatum]